MDEAGSTFSAVIANAAALLDHRERDWLQHQREWLSVEDVVDALSAWVGPGAVEWWVCDSLPAALASEADLSGLMADIGASVEALEWIGITWQDNWSVYDFYKQGFWPHTMDLPTKPEVHSPVELSERLRDAWRAWWEHLIPKGGVPVVGFYIPLPHVLPVPDGYEVQALAGDDWGRRQRLGPVGDVAVSLGVKQATDDRSSVAADMTLLFETVGEMLEEPVSGEIVLSRQMTVVEAYVPIDRAIDLDAELDWHAFSDDFDVALKAVRELQEAYALLVQGPVMLVSLKTLPPAIPVWVGHLERAGAKPRRTETGTFWVNDLAGYQSAPAEPLGEERVEALGNVLVQKNEAVSFAAYASLRREAWNQRDLLGNWRLAALTASLGGEVALDTILLHLLWEEGATPEEAGRLYAVNGPRHTRRVVTEFSERLGGTWNADGEGVIARYINDVVELRHRIVHRGYVPTLTEVDKVLDTVREVEVYLGDRLTSARVLVRFPRTARAWCGDNGLERRGSMTRRMQALLNDPTEPNWNLMFERWRVFAEFNATGRRPVAGAPDNDQVVMLLLWGDGDRRWLVHDREARAAMIIPYPALEPLVEQRATIEAMSAVLQSDGQDPRPFRMLMDGLRYDGNRFHGQWTDEFELLPEADIFLPAHRALRPQGTTRSTRPIEVRPLPP